MVSSRVKDILVVRKPSIPSRTAIADWLKRADGVHNILLAFKDIESKAGTGVPGDMAVKNPGSRVVGLESNGEITALWKHGNVTTRWVVKVEAIGAGVGVVLSRFLSNDREVVAV